MDINDVYTLIEAAQEWGLTKAQVRQAVEGIRGKRPALTPDVETRMSGNIWLVTRSGMERVFGKKPEWKRVERLTAAEFVPALNKIGALPLLANAMTAKSEGVVRKKIFLVVRANIKKCATAMDKLVPLHAEHVGIVDMFVSVWLKERGKSQPTVDWWTEYLNDNLEGN